MVLAQVRVWHDEHGWGVVDSADTPGGCWVHFSHVDVDGDSSLSEGDLVELSYERAHQDGFLFRATRVILPGRSPRRREPGPRPQGAYRSSLFIESDA